MYYFPTKHYPGPASADWFDGFDVFPSSDPGKRDFFNRSNAGLLTAYLYPDIGAAELRACTDLVNVILIVDEYCEDEDGARVREFTNVFLDALRGAPRDDSVFSRIAVE